MRIDCSAEGGEAMKENFNIARDKLRHALNIAIIFFLGYVAGNVYPTFEVRPIEGDWFSITETKAPNIKAKENDDFDDEVSND